MVHFGLLSCLTIFEHDYILFQFHVLSLVYAGISKSLDPDTKRETMSCFFVLKYTVDLLYLKQFHLELVDVLNY